MTAPALMFNLALGQLRGSLATTSPEHMAARVTPHLLETLSPLEREQLARALELTAASIRAAR